MRHIMRQRIPWVNEVSREYVSRTNDSFGHCLSKGDVSKGIMCPKMMCETHTCLTHTLLILHSIKELFAAYYFRHTLLTRHHLTHIVSFDTRTALVSFDTRTALVSPMDTQFCDLPWHTILWLSIFWETSNLLTRHLSTYHFWSHDISTPTLLTRNHRHVSTHHFGTPPAPMNHANIFKGRPRWYSSWYLSLSCAPKCLFYICPPDPVHHVKTLNGIQAPPLGPLGATLDNISIGCVVVPF